MEGFDQSEMWSENHQRRQRHFKSRKRPEVDNSSTHHFFWKSGSIYSNWHFASYQFNDGGWVIGQDKYKTVMDAIVYPVRFATSEHGMMWSKAILFGDATSAAAILAAAGPKEAKKLGRSVQNFKSGVWDRYKKQIMFSHCYEKFKQNPDMKRTLMKSAPKMLVEASPLDEIWGIGLVEKVARVTPVKRWPGQNLLGIALTAVRDRFESELRAEVRNVRDEMGMEDDLYSSDEKEDE